MTHPNPTTPTVAPSLQILDAPIQAVTVYTHQALVTPQATIELTRAERQLVLEGFAAFMLLI